jgi:CRP-like cAMP-binding protein
VSPDLQREAGRILTVHPYAGGRAKDLALVLDECKPLDLAIGQVLCTEGERGEDAYFLLRGAVRVLKKGHRGEDMELAQIDAPALLGHMSLVDKSNRSATCVAADACQLLVLTQRTYATIFMESSARGTALRRLLLSSLTRQLISGNDRLQSLLKEPKPSSESTSSRPLIGTGSAQDDISNADLLRAAGVLEGWQVDPSGIDSVRTFEDEDMRRSRFDSGRRG